MAGLGGKGLRKKDCQIGPVNPFLPRARLSLDNPNCLFLDRVLNNKGKVFAGMGGKRFNFNCKFNIHVYIIFMSADTCRTVRKEGGWVWVRTGR